MTDEYNNVTERIYTANDGDSKKLVVHRSQDVEPFIDASKRALADETHARPFRNPGDKSYKVAHIPNIIVEQWMKEGFNIFDPDPAVQKKLMKRLSSPEWKYLRMYPGRLA